MIHKSKMSRQQLQFVIVNIFLKSLVVDFNQYTLQL